MRTTIRIDDDLLAEAKRFAASTKRSLTSVVENGLREILSRRPSKRKASPIVLPTMGGKGIKLGVNLDDSSALLDLMEEGNETCRR